MAEDANILQEIDDALRLDKAAQFWARNSSTIIAFCVLIVLSTAASEIWKGHMREVHERQTGKLAQATTLAGSGKYGEAVGIFEQVEEDGGQLGALAALNRAQVLISMKQEDKAIAVYDDLAAGKNKAPDVFRDYAALQADILAHNQALSGGKPALATQGGKDARGNSRIFARSFTEIDALRAHDDKNAQTLLTSILNDMDAPFSQRLRAGQQLELLKETSK